MAARSLFVSCDARGLPADAEVVDRLARLALAVLREGAEFWLSRPSQELVQLIDVMGLAEVLRERPDPAQAVF